MAASGEGRREARRRKENTSWKVWLRSAFRCGRAAKGNYGLNNTFTGLGYLYYFWHPRVPLFPFRDRRLNNEGQAGKLVKRADNWDRCYFSDVPTMILVRENAPSHCIPNLYRFLPSFFFLTMRFELLREATPTSKIVQDALLKVESRWSTWPGNLSFCSLIGKFCDCFRWQQVAFESINLRSWGKVPGETLYFRMIRNAPDPKFNFFE